MGILRSDRVSGLGGANAINGSVHFPNDGATGTGDYLRVDSKDNSDFNLGTNDFTMEFWFNSENVGSTLFPFAFAAPSVSSSSDAGFYARFNGGVVNFNCFEGNNTIGSCSTGSVSLNTWYHVAYVRSGSTFTVYLDGTSAATASSAEAVNFDAGWNFNIGSAYSNVYHYNGFLSNLRIVNGTALYTSNFTVPNRLEAVENTVLLCCQSPGNVLQEASGKTLQTIGLSVDSKSVPSTVHASRFVPDVGEDHGTTFTDNTKFDTLSYMVPPGGTTTQRGRGRGVLGGGAPFVSPNVISNMQYIEIQSGGIFKDFGDLTVARGYFPAGHTSSSTRGLSAGGWTGSDNNTIDYITIATTSNATEFGDTSVVRPSAGLSNQTRSVNGGDAAMTNTMDYVTIATTANAQDFGDLTEGRQYGAGVASPTRGVFGGGRNNTPSSNTLKNIMEYITIATTSNTTDFGDLQALRYGQTGFSSAVRGIWAGGYTTPGQTATIDYFTIATLGNSADFGDLGTANGYCSSVTNSIRGAVTINDAPNYYNTIEYITIATLGDAKDFGDSDPTGSGKGHGDFPSSMSDSHGGIS